MIFELSPAHPTDKNGVGRTFCGVAEFTAMEGNLIIFLPFFSFFSNHYYCYFYYRYLLLF
jgi:hypothetical protein